MRKKDYSLLIAAFIGLSSGWAVLNQDVFATEEEPVSMPSIEEGASDLATENETADEITTEDDFSDGEIDQTVPNEEEGKELDQGQDDSIDLDITDSNQNHEFEKKRRNRAGRENRRDSSCPEDGNRGDASGSKKAVAPAPAALKAASLNGWNNNKYYVNNVMAIGETKIGKRPPFI